MGRTLKDTNYFILKKNEIKHLLKLDLWYKNWHLSYQRSIEVPYYFKFETFTNENSYTDH